MQTMIVYIFISGLLFIFSLSQTFKFHPHYNLKLTYFFLFRFLLIFLFLFAGFRFNVGFDYDNYKNIFFGANKVQVEPLYNLIQLLTRITGSYSFHLLVIATISILLKVYFFNKILDYKLKILTLFFYFTSCFLMLEMGVIRQSLAATFILGALYFSAHKKTSAFCFFSLVAIYFHVSALAIIILIFLFKLISLSRSNVLFMLLLSFGLMTFTSYFSDQVSSILVVFGDKYAVYTQNIQPVGVTLGLFLKLLFFFVIYEVLKNRTNSDLVNLFVFVYFCGLCIFISFNSIPILAGRLTPYFKVVEVVLFVLFALQFRTGVSRFFICCFLSLIAISQLIKFLNEDVVVEYYSGYDNVLFNLF